MLILRRFFLTLAVLCLLVGASSTYKRNTCVEPAVRKEWRALSTEEKAEWIRAVNVREVHNTVFRGLNRVDYQCMSHLPHDPALSPRVDPSNSLIPPVNASSSYYDGLASFNQ